MRHLRLVGGILIALVPSALKIPLYRLLFGWEIGRDVRIGLTPFVGVGRCRIGDGTRIGSLNLFWRIGEVDIGEHVQIGFLNLLRGGQRLVIGAYATMLRLNVINSIPDPDVVGPTTPTFELGPGGVVTAGHRLDFTDRITIGAHTIIGGRNSSLWTHNRQRTRPITIGSHCYLGSEVRLAPGVDLPDLCVVALGSVVSGRFTEPRSLIAGNPAETKRELRPSELFLTIRKTRNDVPDSLAAAFLPPDLRERSQTIVGSAGSPPDGSR